LHAKKKRAKPTRGELEILQVLWQGGPMTVRGVYEELSKRKPSGLRFAAVAAPGERAICRRMRGHAPDACAAIGDVRIHTKGPFNPLTNLYVICTLGRLYEPGMAYYVRGPF